MTPHTSERQADCMDAGVAAVLGATVGALGAVGAGWMAAWGTRQQAKTQVRADVERWHREERHRVYAEYMRTAVSVGHHLTGIFGDLEALDVEAVEGKRRTIRDAIPELTSATALVMIQGPSEVSNVALDFANKIDDARVALLAWCDSVHDNESDSSISANAQKVRAVIKKVNELGDKFGNVANSALSLNFDAKGQ